MQSLHILGPSEIQAAFRQKTGLEKAVEYINEQLQSEHRSQHQPLGPDELLFSFTLCVTLSFEEVQRLLVECKKSWTAAQVLYDAYGRNLQVNLSAQKAKFSDSLYVSGAPMRSEVVTAN